MNILINSQHSWRGKDDRIEYTKAGTVKTFDILYENIDKIRIVDKNSSEKELVLEANNDVIKLSFLRANTSEVNRILNQIYEINPSCLSSIMEERRKNEEMKVIKQQQMEETNKIKEQRFESIKNKEYLDVIVTTCDLKEDYEIIGPVYFQLNNAGAGSVFSKLIDEYRQEINEWHSFGQRTQDKVDWVGVVGALYNILNGFNDRDLIGNAHVAFDLAFFIGVQELKKRAALLGADAIIGMKQDLDLDTNGFQHFYLQIYGTAVRRKGTKS